MKNHATNPTTITINSHKIRTMTRNEKRWYHQADVIKALGIADTGDLSKDEINVTTGQEINDPGQMLVAVISESGLNKLSPAAELPTKDKQIAILKNQINVLEELLMDGAGPIKAYPSPARQTEKSIYINQLEAINDMNPDITRNLLLMDAQSLLLEAQGKTHKDALMETMQELMDSHPREYQQMLRRINIDHDFFFDLDVNDCSFDFVFDEK